MDETDNDPTDGNKGDDGIYLEPTPWQRLGAWYKKNEDLVISTCITASIVGLVVYKKLDGMTVKSGSVLTRDDGASVIVVHLKNGKRNFLVKPLAELKVNDVAGMSLGR
jgi:hypothetical protein